MLDITDYITEDKSMINSLLSPEVRIITFPSRLTATIPSQPSLEQLRTVVKFCKESFQAFSKYREACFLFSERPDQVWKYQYLVSPHRIEFPIPSYLYLLSFLFSFGSSISGISKFLTALNPPVMTGASLEMFKVFCI